MPIVILVMGVIALFVLIIGLKLNSFISLLLVCLGVGLAEGLPIAKVVDSIEAGMGGTLGHLAIVVSLGAMLGKMMVDCGAAQRIATSLINRFGKKNVRWAVCLTGFVVGIALFYEVGFVLLIPLVFTVAVSAGLPLLEVGIPMAAALSVTHCFLPPHPGPTAIAVLFNADIGLTLIYGTLIAIPTVIVAGPLFYNTMKDLTPSVPTGLYNPKVFTDAEMPGFWVSILTALVPVFLMAAASISKLALPPASPTNVVLGFVGHPDMALFIAVLVALFTFGLNRQKTMPQLMDTVQQAVTTVAMILLVVGAGGAFKQVLIDGGVGKYIAALANGIQMSPLVLAWVVAAVIRIAVGSATVAALTTGGIMAPIVAATGTNPELMVLATGAGSVILSPPTDPGFWLFKEFFNLSVRETIRSWCVMETAIAVMGLAGVMALNMILH
ncbi:gluconate:H+ symporter [Telmatospirillum sp.]|uniref:gluconate:H+ symporter n=1 Tax=Telmatospirillum sp. TaxID=2079197 RepID=UPI002848C94B|nr:gluconate:H+ symporter [Telmatospirillum sp.]MDR3436804.1 gluconate:H+ symporter [Telmatospirillum sp.]